VQQTGGQFRREGAGKWAEAETGRACSGPQLTSMALWCAVKGGAFLQVEVLPRQLTIQPRSYGRAVAG
jgi:hypothetical protein